MNSRYSILNVSIFDDRVGLEHRDLQKSLKIIFINWYQNIFLKIFYKVFNNFFDKSKLISIMLKTLGKTAMDFTFSLFSIMDIPMVNTVTYLKLSSKLKI